MVERLVCCGDCSQVDGRKAALKLDLHGAAANVRLRISDIGKKLLATVPDELLDLIEIATYIYAADGALRRGGNMDSLLGARWRRSLCFHIPVRNLALWTSEPVQTTLVETLNFLADESYCFEFRPMRIQPPPERYLELQAEAGAQFSPDEVMLFSGGIDSFAGAAELLSQGKRVALVSHRSVGTIGRVQQDLVDDLRGHLGSTRVFHVPIWANLIEGLAQEYTQRTRSFLFAALGFVTARLFGADRISFFENGVVSLNLPPVAQVLGARATRTTHPQTLRGFQALFSAIINKPFRVQSPFKWLTKAEVVQRISDAGFQNLLRHTHSCSRVMELTKLNSHCGLCSQCIDRRFGVLAAGLSNEDPAEAYKIDLFTGARTEGPDREMALSYVRMASEVNTMTDLTFFSKYGEANRALDFFDEPADIAASKMFALYQRHAAGVCEVVEQEIAARARLIREGSLPADCLLSLVAGQSARSLPYAVTTAPTSLLTDLAQSIRIAVDEEKVVIQGLGELKRVSIQILKTLAGPYREAREAELLPQHYRFLPTKELLKLLGIEEEEILRKQVQRCRREISNLAIAAGREPFDVNAVIESSSWHGYRLNPDNVQIVAMSEIQR